MITPELPELLDIAIDSALLDVHTAIPAIVQDYDSATRTSTVEIQVKRALDSPDLDESDLVYESLPVLMNVRVAFLSTSKYYMSLPVEAGDTGLLIFCEVPTGQWRALDAIAEPETAERHGLSGAVFYPGLMKDAAAIDTASTDDLQDGARFGVVGGAHIVIKDGGEMKLDNQNGYVKIEPGGRVDINGNLTVDV